MHIDHVVQNNNFIIFYDSVAKYYNQSGDTVDLIPTVSSLLGVPCSILAAYIVCHYGLKNALYFGSALTGIGNLFGNVKYCM